MASLRTHTRIARSADDVWNAMSDAGGISTWFSGIEQSSASGSTRSCRLAGGMQSTGYRTTPIRASPTAVAKGSPKPSPAREWT